MRRKEDGREAERLAPPEVKLQAVQETADQLHVCVSAYSLLWWLGYNDLVASAAF